MTHALADASDATLKSLRDKVKNGYLALPLTSSGLQSEGLGQLVGSLPHLVALSGDGINFVVEAILAERQKSKGPHLSLVWTGPENTHGTGRDTWVVFRELLTAARRQVLIAGFRFDNGADLLEPLHKSMKQHGVSAQFFIDVPPARADVPLQEHARKFVQTFIAKNWPFGQPHPSFFFDPRTAQPQSKASLHAKCVVVDEQFTLIGSANFTDRGQSRNIELGVCIDSQPFATEVLSHWQGLIRAKLVRAA